MTSSHGESGVRKCLFRVESELATVPRVQLGASLGSIRVAMKNLDGDARLEEPSPKWRLVRLPPLPGWHHRSPRLQGKSLHPLPTLSNLNRSHLREEK